MDVFGVSRQGKRVRRVVARDNGRTGTSRKPPVASRRSRFRSPVPVEVYRILTTVLGAWALIGMALFLVFPELHWLIDVNIATSVLCVGFGTRWDRKRPKRNKKRTGIWD